MFGSIGMPELLIIFTVALIVFGPRKLPELGRSLGKSLQEFKRASHELKHTLDEEISIEERKAIPAATATAAASLPATDPSMIDTPTAPETIARGHEQN
jgi:sec-independent protein translocase protein TatA